MEDSGSSLSPKIGTIIIGVLNFTFAGWSVVPVKHFKRRTLVLFGHLLMSVLMFLVGLFSYLGENNLMFAALISFLFAFQSTDGPVLFLYASEVTVDSGLGFCVFGVKSTGLLISLTTEYLMDSALHPHGAFWLYSGIILVGFVYFYFCMKETSGLTDKQKKELYRT